MAMRLEKSGELMRVYGTKDEPDDQQEWNTRRRKLGAFVAALAVVTAVLYLGPHIPGYQMVSSAIKSVVATIW